MITIDQFVSGVAGLSALVALGAQGYAAYKTGQWWKLIGLAGDVTYSLADMAGMTNDEKRKIAEKLLYDRAPVQMRRLFSEKQFTEAVEYGWEMIAKPRLVAHNPAKAS